MKDYSNPVFQEIAEQISKSQETIININIADIECISLQHFLTRHYYYTVIVDDYAFDIYNKASLLEALYYQAKLITVHDLNWDAIQEGLNDALSNFLEFTGVCLLFKKGYFLKNRLPDEFKMLTEVINDINSKYQGKQIKILLNQ